MNPDGSCRLFDATVTLNAASQPCAASLSCSLSSAFAAFQDPGGVFTGGASVPGGVPVACGVIAQPAVLIHPDTVCFHSDAPKSVSAEVAPDMEGTCLWYWSGGAVSSPSGRHTNISWDGGASSLNCYFTAAGAAAARCATRGVTKCPRTEAADWCDSHNCEHALCACDSGGMPSDWCGFHDQPVSKCGESKTTGFGGTVREGQPVYAEGTGASPCPWADRLLWRWVDANDDVHYLTNRFTVLSVRLFGDIDLDGEVDAEDKALHPALSEDYGWGLPVSGNVFRKVRLRTDVGANMAGIFTLSLSGDPGIRIWTTGSPASTNSPLLVCGQTVTNGVNGVSFLTGYDTDLYVEAASNGTAKLTYGFTGTGAADGLRCAAALGMTAVTVTLEPVTGENSPEVYNPCGIPAGGTAYYKIAVEPAAAVPDESIAWGVDYGDVSFVNGDNTGRLVAVGAGSTEGEFGLTVDIGGTPFSPAPSVRGTVLDPKTVPVRVWIVRDDSGDNAACTESRVQELLGGMNAIYKQCAMTFYVNGAIQYTNREEWLDINFTNGWSGELESIRNIETATGSIELYFVHQFIFDNEPNDHFLGVEDSQGIVLTSRLSDKTLAHEIGHACGLLDIYPYRSVSNTVDMAVSGPVTAERLPQDWGGGYYPPDLLQPYLIAYRLLMMGYEDPTITTTCDIPLGSVYGTWFERTPPLFEGDTGTDMWYQSPAPVGLDSMGNRQPCHQ